jgi:hypothetical protein
VGVVEKALLSNDLPTEFAKWREMAADRNQWRAAVCGYKMPSGTKETSSSSRQDIWAELRYGIIPSSVQKRTRKFQMSKRDEQKMRRNTYSQTSWLENPEELQLDHNHEQFLFDCSVALCTMQD